MKIDSSNIIFNSQHSSTKQVTSSETLRAWVGDHRPNFEGKRAMVDNQMAAADQVRISLAGQQMAASERAPTGTKSSNEVKDAADQVINDPKMQLLIIMIESLTGIKVKIFDARDLSVSNGAQNLALQDPNAANTPKQGFGIEYDKHESIHESEQTSFSAQGTVKTSDGHEIKFDLSFSMQREFSQESNVSIRAGEAVKKDPLVINFNGTAAQLTDTKFSFDLNSDGKDENISFVGGGSGFLALDKNNNGKIDNGSELFGTKSGNGFADLAAYDSDGNHWIDENDAVYSKLRVWSKDASGADTLSTLAQRNVGALFLGNLATPFDLKTNTNETLGQVRSTGVYLQENGSAGTLQQVDLVA